MGPPLGASSHTAPTHEKRDKWGIRANGGGFQPPQSSETAKGDEVGKSVRTVERIDGVTSRLPTGLVRHPWEHHMRLNMGADIRKGMVFLLMRLLSNAK